MMLQLLPCKAHRYRVIGHLWTRAVLQGARLVLDDLTNLLYYRVKAARGPCIYVERVFEEEVPMSGLQVWYFN